MNAKTFVLLLGVATLAATGGYLAARRSPPLETSAASERKIRFYQSPMHPWIKSDRPGKCTICGMALVPVYEGEAGIATDGGVVALNSASAAVIGLQTAEIVRAPLLRTLRVAGTIDDDETRHRYIAAYVDARIEKLFVHTTGVEVTEGQRLAIVYSPDLLIARQEFYALARSGPSSLLNASREKLLRLGLLDTQIDTLATAPEVSRDTEILAPKTGTVVARGETAYEGGYVNAGETLFTLGDFSQMWFVFDAYEADLPHLALGQPIEITVPSLPGETFTAPIAFIDSNLNASTRTARIRVILDNPDRRLLHRQTAYGHIVVRSPDTLVVPRSAVLFTQANPLVYIDEGSNAYAPRQVRLGRAGDDVYEVLSGLDVGDKVVTQSALLIDSQAQIAHSGSPTPATREASPVAPTATTPLPSSLVLTAADAAAALASDNLPAYAQLLPTLTAAVHQSGAAHDTLVPLAAALTAGPDLAAARKAFEPFSTAVADLIRVQPADQRGVKIFECPMSPVLGRGRWLQRADPLRNPFFGSEMLECGEELKD